jgi:hypothetical protein
MVMMGIGKGRASTHRSPKSGACIPLVTLDEVFGFHAFG